MVDSIAAERNCVHGVGQDLFNTGYASGNCGDNDDDVFSCRTDLTTVKATNVRRGKVSSENAKNYLRISGLYAAGSRTICFGFSYFIFIFSLRRQAKRAKPFHLLPWIMSVLALALALPLRRRPTNLPMVSLLGRYLMTRFGGKHLLTQLLYIPLPNS